ncbi:hypothetical protein M5U04_20980 [Xenorhabdus sp. XENO-1]|uniref:hypothetical protein n=1 Tax=Xenorhabdus bovienii TaxID=40576 RepID=UPI0020CA6D3A|nr:hypothetical protein [Xenorhabdus bovienii]MCP9270472.1 hypothetical protein [Xenorhabdus bovienii subsp. africana]
MNILLRIDWRHSGLIFVLFVILGLAGIYIYQVFYSHEPEIALMIGEPYEDMQQRSSAAIDPALPGKIWYNIPKTDARLRFTDPKYGFMTPPARFFVVKYNNGIIESVRISPQIEPLLFDDVIKIVLDLQNQWRKAGWISVYDRTFPPLANTPELRTQLRSLKCSETTYWRAGDQYQIMMNLGCFNDKKHPDEERFMITMEIAKAR